MNRRLTYIVLLNWRGWRDTIACLQSIFASSEHQYRVIVCDNGSGDGSLAHIEAWARGAIHVAVPEQPRLAGLLRNSVHRPSYRCIDRGTAESGRFTTDCPLVLVDNGGNIGFAAGNNVGLRLALSQPDMDSVWLLNNDTLVEPDCLSQMRGELKQAEGRAVVGSIIHFFDQPEIIQAVGGNRFNRFTGVAACSESRFLHEARLEATGALCPHIDYLSGCSMLLPRAFLEEVGLMSEDYFLYYEEIDWFTRARGRFPIRVAPGARLYHREGSAIGSRSWRPTASLLSDYHMQRSRLIFMRKHYPRRVAGCYLAGLLDAGKRMARGQFRNARIVLSVLMGRREAWIPA